MRSKTVLQQTSYTVYDTLRSWVQHMQPQAFYSAKHSDYLYVPAALKKKNSTVYPKSIFVCLSCVSHSEHRNYFTTPYWMVTEAQCVWCEVKVNVSIFNKTKFTRSIRKLPQVVKILCA